MENINRNKFHPDLGYRVFPEHWTTDKEFDRLVDFVVNNMNKDDEIWLFDDHFPKTPYIELEKIKEKNNKLKERLNTLRNHGFNNVGINVINTLGHGSYKGKEVPFRKMTGHKGEVNKNCSCPNDKEYRKYIREKLKLIAGANPEFIWIDDDYRMIKGGVQYACFCDSCLRQFGYEGTREEFIKDLNRPENKELRKNWNEFIITSLETFAENVKEAIFEVDPEIKIGLMSVGYSLSTYARGNSRWFEAMGATRARPGHGYYTEAKPGEILNKVFDVGRLIKDMPPEVEVKQYEWESFPWINLLKSNQTMINESTLAIMEGCTGVAYNLLRYDAGTLEEFEKPVKDINQHRSLWAEMLEKKEKMEIKGIWPAFNTRIFSERNIGEEGWFNVDDSYDIQKTNNLWELGVAFNPGQESSCGTLLSGKIAEAFNREELEQILSTGVLMDGDALSVIWKKGLGELTGVKRGERITEIFEERFTRHELNGDYKNDGRYVGKKNEQPIYNLISLNYEVEEVSYLIDFDNNRHGSCFTVFENELGGRIAVNSFDTWEHLGSLPKRSQILSVIDWLTFNKLPLIINKHQRIAPIICESKNGREILVSLLNMSFDDTEEFTITYRGNLDYVEKLLTEGRQELSCEKNGERTVITIPSISPWEITVLYGNTS